MSNPRDSATNTEYDRSVRNAPHGQQVVFNGLPVWASILLIVGLALCVFLAWDSSNNATRAAERAFQAQQASAINREYAVQVVGQLNRMGFPVMSPGEKDHPIALPEDYAALDAFSARRIAEMKEEKP